jgi:hypothetical protein
MKCYVIYRSLYSMKEQGTYGLVPKMKGEFFPLKEFLSPSFIRDQRCRKDFFFIKFFCELRSVFLNEFYMGSNKLLRRNFFNEVMNDFFRRRKQK